MTGKEPDLTAELLNSGFEDRLPVDPASRARALEAAMDAFDLATADAGVADIIDVDLAIDIETGVDAGPNGAHARGGRWFRRRPSLPVALVAAALMLVVATVGVLLVLTPDGEDRLRTGVADDPVDVSTPTPTPPAPTVTAEPTDWTSWADANEPADVLACVARSALRTRLQAELPPPNPVGPDPESQWLLAQLRGFVGLAVALAPVVEPDAVDATAADVSLLAEADEAAFADAGSPDETFATQVAALRAALVDNPLWAADPQRCWLDRPEAQAGLQSLTDRIGPEAAVRCLAAETLERALAWQAADLTVDRTATIGQALVQFTGYAASEDLELLTLLGELSLIDPEAPDAAASMEDARRQLADRGLRLGDFACRTSS